MRLKNWELKILGYNSWVGHHSRENKIFSYKSANEINSIQKLPKFLSTYRCHSSSRQGTFQSVGWTSRSIGDFFTTFAVLKSTNSNYWQSAEKWEKNILSLKKKKETNVNGVKLNDERLRHPRKNGTDSFTGFPAIYLMVLTEGSSVSRFLSFYPRICLTES